MVNAAPRRRRLLAKVRMVARLRATSAVTDRKSINSRVIGITAARGSTPERMNAGSAPRGKLRTMVGGMLGLTEVGETSCGHYSGQSA